MKKRLIKFGIFILILVIIIIIMASIQTTKNQQQASLITEDGYTLSYDFHKVSDKGVILLHMMNRNKEDYKEFSKFLNDNGYSTIAIDLRGHGKSTDNLASFNDKDFQNMVYDIKAAKNFLLSKDINKISIVGASISANLALIFASNSDIKRIILLSPGENYHNVKIDNALKQYQGSILFVAAKDDPYSYNTTTNANLIYKGNHNFISYETAGHGTFMFQKHPELKGSILEFLNNN